MRIQRTSQIITVVVLLLSALTIVSAAISLYYRGLQESDYASRRVSSNMTSLLADGSDRLTGAVRAYAATGDKRYYEAFLRELNVDRSRDRAVTELMKLDLTDVERSLLNQAKQNSDQLVRLENRAFEAVNRKDMPAAIALVFGDEYNTAKASIMQPIAEFRLSLDNRLTTRAEKLSGQARLAATIGIIALIANAFAILGALLMFYRRRVVNPLAAINRNLRDLIEKKEGVSIGHQMDNSEIGELARSLDSYRQAAEEAQTQRWVKSHVAEIAGALQKSEDVRKFAESLLPRLLPLVQGGCGAFYHLDESSGRFNFVGGYGFQQRAGISPSFALGEGIVGQCAVERKRITLRDVPADYITIASGIGQAPPRMIIAAPIVSLDRTLGVIEIATFSEPSPTQAALLDEVMPTVSMNLEILQRNLKTQDLLEKMRSQQESLRASEEQFRTLLEAAPDALIISDQSGRILLINAQTEKLFGYSRGELVGQPVEVLVPERIRAGHPALRQRYHANPGVRAMGASLDLSAVRKDGSEFPVEISLSPLTNKEGGMLVCSSLRDITERKRLDNELREAMKKAEEATKAKSAFLANMSHEIRTPMNGIIGMTELALDTELTAEQRDYMNTVKSSADALLMLINDILDFSKIEAGRIELDPIEFLLRDSISDTLNPLALRAASKGLELAYDVQADVPDALVGDVYRLRQIIVNLVGNAIKFTQTGEVVVSVRLAAKTADDVRLEFSVRDTGIGIDPAAAARLFKPFEQADAATTRKYGGTGLGLAISRQLAELMGGQIQLQSKSGEGSTFSFTVQMKPGVARPAATAEDAARVFENKHALIVDDNDTNRRILSAMLGHWGLKSIQADSGESALASLDRAANAGQAVSLIITDLHMPLMDGFTLVESIRSRAALATLPVIMLTSSASPGDQDHCTRLRVAARLLKPVKQSLLLDNLMRIFSGAMRLDSPSPAGGQPAMPSSAGKALQVLLAEDNPINQKFAVRLLEGAGHKVTLAHNGRQAVDLQKSNPFDLILMDVQMPEMDGLDATRAIREGEAGSGKRIPIVAMTANAMKGDREMCIDSGMDGYVTKPVRKEAMFQEIDRVLSGS